MPTALLAVPEFLDWLEPGRPLLLQAEAEGAIRLEEAPTFSSVLLRWAARAKREGGRWQVIIVTPEATLLTTQTELLTALTTEPATQLATVTLLAYSARPDVNPGPVERFGWFLADAPPMQRRRVVRTEELFKPEVLAPLEAAYLILALTRTELPTKGEFVLKGVTLNREALAGMVADYRTTLTAAEQQWRKHERRQAVPEYEDRSDVPPYVPPATPEELLEHPEGSPGNPPNEYQGTVLPRGWIQRASGVQAAWEQWQETNVRALDRQATMLQRYQREQLERKLTENADRLEQEGTATSKALTRAEIDQVLAARADERARLAKSQHTKPGPGPLNAERWQQLRQDFLIAAQRRPRLWLIVVAPLAAAALLLPALPLDGRPGWVLTGLALLSVTATWIVTAQRIRSAFHQAHKAARDAVRHQLTHLLNASKQGQEQLQQQLRIWHGEQNARLLEDAARDLRAHSRLLEWHESLLRKRLRASEAVARTFPATPASTSAPKLELKPALNEANNALYRLGSYAPASKQAQLRVEGATRLLEDPEFAGLTSIILEGCAASPERNPNP